MENLGNGKLQRERLLTQGQGITNNAPGAWRFPVFTAPKNYSITHFTSVDPLFLPPESIQTEYRTELIHSCKRRRRRTRRRRSNNVPASTWPPGSGSAAGRNVFAGARLHAGRRVLVGEQQLSRRRRALDYPCPQRKEYPVCVDGRLLHAASWQFP